MSKYFKFIGYVGLVIFSIGALADFVTLCMLTKQIMELKKSGIDDVTSNFLLGICVFSFIVMLVFGPASSLLFISHGNHLEETCYSPKINANRFVPEKPLPRNEEPSTTIGVQEPNSAQPVSEVAKTKPIPSSLPKDFGITLKPSEVLIDNGQIFFQSKCFDLSDVYGLQKNEDSVFFFIADSLVQIEKCGPAEIENIYDAIAADDGYQEAKRKRDIIAESGKGQTLTENEIEELLQMSADDLLVCLEN